LFAKDKEKIKQLEARAESAEGNNMKLILESIHNNETLTDEVQTQLEELANRFRYVEPRITSEIEKAMDLFNNGMVEKSIFSLAKVIENMLKVHYEEKPNNLKRVKAWIKGIVDENNRIKNLVKLKKQGEYDGEIPSRRNHVPNTNYKGYLQYAMEVDKKITKEELMYINALKEIRNIEAHEVGVDLPDWVNKTSMTTAINGITKIAVFVYPPKNYLA
jgi:hypothetical protein